MVHHTIAHTSFMNKTWLRVRKTKANIRPVLIRSLGKIFLQQREMVDKSHLKVSNITSVSFPPQKFSPHYEQIF